MVKTEINSKHALIWAVVGYVVEPGTRVFWSTYTRDLARVRLDQVLEALEDIGWPIDKVKRTNGDEEIRLINTSRLVFRPRECKAFRGFSVDKLILDQAYTLTDNDLGSLLPFLAGSHEPDLVYSGTNV